jgi:hypothetical protein
MDHTWHRLNAGLLGHPGAGTPNFLLGVRQQTPPTPGGEGLRAFTSRFILPAAPTADSFLVLLLWTDDLPVTAESSEVPRIKYVEVELK